jgi:F-type H+-transporting ATPase subunit a
MQAIQNRFSNSWQNFRAWIDKNPRRAALWAAAIILFIVGFFLNVPEPHVALGGEPILSTSPRWFTNAVLLTIIVDIVLILIAVLATARMKLIPTGLQNFMEFVIEFLYNLAESIAGPRARAFFPWAATIFLFVLISNWSGLIPGVGSIGFYRPAEHAQDSSDHVLRLGNQLALADGKLIVVERDGSEQPLLAQAATPEATEEHAEEGDHATEEGELATGESEKHFVPLFRAPSADLNMTFALAISTVVMVQIWGVRTQGAAYFKKFTNASGENAAMKGINVFVSFLEIISEFSRILAFGFRLFGNIFAGEVVLATMAFLVPFFLPLPFYALEVFVGVIQALVFTMLALVFFTMATISHGHDDHGGGHGDAHGHDDHAAAPAATPATAEASH